MMVRVSYAHNKNDGSGMRIDSFLCNVVDLPGIVKEIIEKHPESTQFGNYIKIREV